MSIIVVRSLASAVSDPAVMDGLRQQFAKMAHTIKVEHVPPAKFCYTLSLPENITLGDICPGVIPERYGVAPIANVSDDDNPPIIEYASHVVPVPSMVWGNEVFLAFGGTDGGITVAPNRLGFPYVRLRARLGFSRIYDRPLNYPYNGLNLRWRQSSTGIMDLYVRADLIASPVYKTKSYVFNQMDGLFYNEEEMIRVSLAQTPETSDAMRSTCYRYAWVPKNILLRYGGATAICACCGRPIDNDSGHTIRPNGRDDYVAVCDRCWRETPTCVRCGEHCLMPIPCTAYDEDGVAYDGQRWLCHSCADNELPEVEQCFTCGGFVFFEDPDQANYIGGRDNDGHWVCQNCVRRNHGLRNRGRSAIVGTYHSQADNGRYLNGKFNGADVYNTRTYGFELEMAGGRFNTEAFERFSNDGWVKYEEDGSLPISGGILGPEVVSCPMTLETFREFPLEDLCAVALSNGYKSHDVPACGLHVHIGKTALSFADRVKIDAFVNKATNFWVPVARRNYPINRYCLSNDEKPLYLLGRECVDRNRYVAVNIWPGAPTIELRIFKGSLKASTVRATVYLVDYAIRAMRDLSVMYVINRPYDTAHHVIQYVVDHVETEKEARIVLKYLAERKLVAVHSDGGRDKYAVVMLPRENGWSGQDWRLFLGDRGSSSSRWTRIPLSAWHIVFDGATAPEASAE